MQTNKEKEVIYDIVTFIALLLIVILFIGGLYFIYMYNNIY